MPQFFRLLEGGLARSRALTSLRRLRRGSNPLAEFEHPLGRSASKHLHEAGDYSGPPGLMAGAEPGPIVAMEVLVEQNEIAPVRILLEFPGSSINRTPPFSVAQEDPGQAPAQFLCNLQEGHLLPRPGGTLNFEIIPVKGVVV